MLFFVLLVVAAIFAPASILNYVAEGKLKSAFSFSMLKRMASKAYAIGWFVAGIYLCLILAILFGMFLLASYMQNLPSVLIAVLILLLEAVFFWFPGITIWTILGEAWANAYKKEYYG